MGFGQTAYAVFFVITLTVLLFAGLHAFRNRRGGANLVVLRNAAILIALSVAPMKPIFQAKSFAMC